MAEGASPAVEAEYVSMDVEAAPRPPSRVTRRLLVAVSCLAIAALGTAAYAGLDLPTAGALEAITLKATPRQPHTGEWCTGSGAATYSKTTLKTIAERTVYGLLPYSASAAESKYEASDVIRVGEKFYVVCDSSWSIFKISHSLPLLSSDNEAIGPDASFVPPAGEDSGFEAILHDASSEEGADFYVVRESILHEKKGTYHAQILKLHFSGDTYSVVETCSSEFAFEGDSKGFEGATSLRGADGVLYILGLCEGNFCSEKRGKEVGNGRVVVMTRFDDGSGGCVWETVKTLELPKSVQFIDYSAFTVHHSSMAVAVTSQENSQIWVGALSGGSDGKFDPESAVFNEGKTYDFPRTSGSCEVQYCNIEGIHWVSGTDEDVAPQVLVGVSDKMKSKGKQPAMCLDKDQSVHLFSLP